MAQEKTYLYPDGETPLMKYLGKKMGEVPEKEEMYLYMTAYNGASCRIRAEIADLWQDFQNEITRAVEAGEIEDPVERGKRLGREQFERLLKEQNPTTEPNK